MAIVPSINLACMADFSFRAAGPAGGDCPGTDPDTVLLLDMEGDTDRTGQFTPSLRNDALLGASDSPCGGNSLQLPLEAAHMFLDDSPLFQLESGSFDLWAKLPSMATTGGVFSRDARSSEQSGHLSLYWTPEDRLLLRVQSPTATLQRCSEVISVGVWHRVGVNFGATGFELWVDGVEQQSVAPITSEGRPPECELQRVSVGMDGNVNPLAIGASTDDTAEGAGGPVTETLVGGEIDHVRLSRVPRDYASQ